jgi:IS605 OrfB family transposase
MINVKAMVILPGGDATVMQRTMRLRLETRHEDALALLRTMEEYTRAFDMVAEWGYQNHSNNKIDAHKNTYRAVRQQIPDLPSSLVQCARDCACEALRGVKRNGYACQPKRNPHTALRYNKCVASVYLDSGYVTLATVSGRVKVTFIVPDYFHKYDGWKVRSSNLVYDRGSKVFYLCITLETDKVPDTTVEKGVLGIDRGINNVAVTSDNRFFNSKAINNVRGRYAYLRGQLQSKGTRSAKRKLIRLSGRERRFKADMNHKIAKEIVNAPYGAFVLEDLTHIVENKKCRNRGSITRRRKNQKLGNWSFYQFEEDLRYKAEELGKTVILVDPSYTSQKCPRCGCVHRENRYGPSFKCIECDYQLHSDLVASRNIAQLGISELSRLLVNKPIVASHDIKVGYLGRGQLQALSPEVG